MTGVVLHPSLTLSAESELRQLLFHEAHLESRGNLAEDLPEVLCGDVSQVIDELQMAARQQVLSYDRNLRAFCRPPSQA
jgi:hypothetical protein